jgi:hypothetical protein
VNEAVCFLSGRRLAVSDAFAGPRHHKYRRAVDPGNLDIAGRRRVGFTLFEIGTFSPDGAYSGANVNPSHSTHKGVWVRTADRKFLLTVLFFTHDDKGVFNGIVKARIQLTLAEDLKSYDSVAERVVTDTSGNVLQVVPGIVGRVRMNVEMPQGPSPQ